MQVVPVRKVKPVRRNVEAYKENLIMEIQQGTMSFISQHDKSLIDHSVTSQRLASDPVVLWLAARRRQ
jgi:hypothetical protein